MALLTNRNLILLLVAIGIGRFIENSPYFVGIIPFVADSVADGFHVVKDHPVLDAILEPHRAQLGADYDGYRNHCYRVFSFALHHLGNHAAYKKREHLLAVAVAYHDLALWVVPTTTTTPTTGPALAKLNYLEPSVALMERELSVVRARQDAADAQAVAAGKDPDQIPYLSAVPLLDEAALEAARQMIRQHHKLTPWHGGGVALVIPDGGDEWTEETAFLVNALRRADWTDVTYGIWRSGIPPSIVHKVCTELPAARFHASLLARLYRLSPHSWIGRLEILRIFKW